MFVGFDLVNPKHDDIMKILKPYRSKKIATEIERHPTWTYRGEYHDPEGSKRTSGTKIDRDSEPEAIKV